LPGYPEGEPGPLVCCGVKEYWGEPP
jgi:hypothetical protein